MKPAKPKPSPSERGHTAKVVPLPKGWEKFEVVPSGHPGEGWLSAIEFAKGRMAPCSARRMLNDAVERGECEMAERKVGRSIIRFFRPL